MRKNLEISGGLIVSEKVMFELGKFLGKQTAHALVYELAMTAQEQGIPFSVLLKQDEKVRRYLDDRQIDALLDPANYLGEAVEKVEQVTALAKAKGWTDGD